MVRYTSSVASPSFLSFLILSLSVFLVLTRVSAGTPGAGSSLMKECVGPFLGDEFCYEVTVVDCLILNVDLKWGDFQRSRELSFPTLARELEKLGSAHGEICQENILYGDGGEDDFSCKVCSKEREITVDADDLHFRGNLEFSCNTPLGKIGQNISVSDIDVDGCSDLTFCGEEDLCNGNGKCGILGCNCGPGYAGSDCSIHVDSESKCVSGSQFPTHCWSMDVVDCESVRYQLTDADGKLVNDKTVKFRENSITLVPFQHATKDDVCDVQIIASNLRVAEDELVGCPQIQYRCSSGTPVNDEIIECITFAKSPSLVCEDPPTSGRPRPGTGQTSSVGKTVMIGAISLLVVCGIAGALYFIFARVLNKNGSGGSEYEGLSLGLDEDMDDDVSVPLASPFDGSSDEESL